jgi:hypothetical protein
VAIPEKHLNDLHAISRSQVPDETELSGFRAKAMLPVKLVEWFVPCVKVAIPAKHSNVLHAMVRSQVPAETWPPGFP